MYDIIYYILYNKSEPLILYRVAGELELIPADTGRAAGYTMDESPVHHRVNKKRKTTNTHTQVHTYGQSRATN